MAPSTRITAQRTVAATILLLITLQGMIGVVETTSVVLDFIRDISNPALHINLLTLECTDASTGNSIPNAVFFRNRDVFFDLADPRQVEPDRPVQRVIPDGNQIVFTITLQAEGNYSCGRRIDEVSFRRSLPKSFVGKLTV